MKTYLYSYPYEGSRWTLEIKARDAVDAGERLRAITHYAEYDGELVAKIPAALGIFARIVVVLRNAIVAR